MRSQSGVKLLIQIGLGMCEKMERQPQILYNASLASLQYLVGLLLRKGPDFNAQGGYYGNPLQAASIQGHIEIVQLLLDKALMLMYRIGTIIMPCRPLLLEMTR